MKTRMLWVLGLILCGSNTLWGYSGGKGTADDPYQIATAQDLINLGNTPADYTKHFTVTKDIDLAGRVFSRAVVAPDTSGSQSPTANPLQGKTFEGVWHGNGHVISNLKIEGRGILVGLFGVVGYNAVIMDTRLDGVVISGTAHMTGSLAGYSDGTIINCSGVCQVSGGVGVGGLVGAGTTGMVFACRSTGKVNGTSRVGGLIGDSGSYVLNSYSTTDVAGTDQVGGLLGYSWRLTSCCYSAGRVSGTTSTGGLIGAGGVYQSDERSFWDMNTSGQTESEGGKGLTTTQMRDIASYQAAGWDFLGQTTDGICEIWQMPQGGGYPELSVFGQGVPTNVPGTGTPDSPFLISDVAQLGCMYRLGMGKHYRLVSDIDFNGVKLVGCAIPLLAGSLDGNNHVISGLTISGSSSYLGLLGQVARGGEVFNLYMHGMSIDGHPQISDRVGGLAAANFGTLLTCHTEGTVIGNWAVGGLTGVNEGIISRCDSSGSVNGGQLVGGLVGRGSLGSSEDSVTECLSTADVTGIHDVGGLLGYTYYETTIKDCYATGSVSGEQGVGGLVGCNLNEIRTCLSKGQVTGSVNVGGLVGQAGSPSSKVTNSFWDTRTSGQTSSAGGTPKTTAQMMDINTYLATGWDFVVETQNGTSDIWRMPRLQGYPILAWTTMYPGEGTLNAPFTISTPDQLVTVAEHPEHWGKSFVLAADVNLAGEPFLDALIAPSPASASGGTPVFFTGTFNGEGHTISNLTITAPAKDTLGLFGSTGASAVIEMLALANCKITGHDYVGALIGWNGGQVKTCSATGQAEGNLSVGGLVGYNIGSVIEDSYAHTGVKATTQLAGGLVAWNQGMIRRTYSTGQVTSPYYAGGLVGFNSGGSVMSSFWDTQTSGLSQSDAGTGKTTAQMQQSQTFLGAWWDFVDESANGTADLWTMVPGDYPVFAWQKTTPAIPSAVAWWALDETSGTQAEDSAGSSNGVVYGATWVAGKIGGALQFSGMNSYVDCGNADALAPERLTLSLWISLPTPASKEYVLGKALGLSAVKDYSLAVTADGHVEFYFSDSSGKSVTASTSSAVANDTWVHVAAVRDGSKALVYVNGALAGSQGYAFTVANKQHPLTLGALNPSVSMAYFKGKIDDVRLYDVALAESQVMSLYQQTPGQ